MLLITLSKQNLEIETLESIYFQLFKALLFIELSLSSSNSEKELKIIFSSLNGILLMLLEKVNPNLSFNVLLNKLTYIVVLDYEGKNDICSLIVKSLAKLIDVMKNILSQDNFKIDNLLLSLIKVINSIEERNPNLVITHSSTSLIDDMIIKIVKNIIFEITKCYMNGFSIIIDGIEKKFTIDDLWDKYYFVKTSNCISDLYVNQFIQLSSRQMKDISLDSLKIFSYSPNEIKLALLKIENSLTEIDKEINLNNLFNIIKTYNLKNLDFLKEYSFLSENTLHQIKKQWVSVENINSLNNKTTNIIPKLEFNQNTAYDNSINTNVKSLTKMNIGNITKYQQESNENVDTFNTFNSKNNEHSENLIIKEKDIINKQEEIKNSMFVLNTYEPVKNIRSVDELKKKLSLIKTNKKEISNQNDVKYESIQDFNYNNDQYNIGNNSRFNINSFNQINPINQNTNNNQINNVRHFY